MGVMFVRLWKWGVVSCIQVFDGQQRRCDFSSDDAASGVKKILRGWTDKRRKYLVSLDGYVQGVHENEVVLSICLLWRNFDRENRRLAVTTSMSSRGKKSDEQDRLEKVKEMKAYSWTLEEYQDAAKYDLLYMSVTEAMGTSLGK